MTSTDLAVTSTPLSVKLPQPELDRFARLGKWLAALEGGKDDPDSRGAANALRFYYAEQLELPATAVAQLTVIHGRLFVGAELNRALAARAGYRVTRTESTAESCTAGLIRVDTGELLGTATFTIEEARTAGLIREGSGWKKHPARMLWARASTLVIRDFAPMVSLGMHSEDEIPEVTRTAPTDDLVDEIVETFDAELVDDLDADFGPAPPAAIDEEEKPKRRRSAAEVKPYVPPEGGNYGEVA